MLNKDQFIIEMTYHSCALEGNSMTFEETTMVYNNQELNLYYNDREFNEIVNHFDAMELMLCYVDQKEVLSNRVIKDMHFELCKNILHDAGSFKSHDNYIQNTNVQTLSPHLVESMMYQWCENINYRLSINESDEMKLREIIEAHVEFEQYHPFSDGNGRIGRILINYLLLQEDLSPLIIKKQDELKYKQFLHGMSPDAPDRGTVLNQFLIKVNMDMNNEK